MKNNIFDQLPKDLKEEVFEEIINSENIKIERIVSKGHTSPKSGWYEQSKNEWIILLQGEAVLSFDDTSEIRLKAGDYLNIPACSKHKVSWTKPDKETIWLAIHY